MGQTAAEKILSRHCGNRPVEPGEFISADVDLLMMNDITGALAAVVWDQAGFDRVWDPDKITVVEDHFMPTANIAAAEMGKTVREWISQHGVSQHFRGAEGGIEHAVLPERGMVLPGELVIGGDSHTCTYGALNCFATGVGSTDCAVVAATGKVWLRVPETIKVTFTGKRRPWVTGKDLALRQIGEMGVEGANYQVLEYHGEVVAGLDVEERLTIANMATEAQAKAGLFPVDRRTREYLDGRAQRPWSAIWADADARYAREVTIDVSDLEPQVAFPYSPENVHPLSEALGVRVDQVFIGSCTNARISDLRTAANIMRGKRTDPKVRCIVIPASNAIYRQALKEGLIELFMDAGAVVSTSTCGACFGGHMGVLGSEEVCVSTSNRNFPGRMGHKTAQVYLASPAVAAATAIMGRIADPSEIATQEVVAV
ncbi:MAG: 3-isopropylmalate dehydratase large subunit [Chloroflexota bacterium]